MHGRLALRGRATGRCLHARFTLHCTPACAQICSNVIENLHSQVRRQVQEDLGTAAADMSSAERNARERKRKKLEAAAILKVFANKMKPLEQSEIYDEVRTAARRAIRRRRKRERDWTLDSGQEPKDGLRDLDLDDWAARMEEDGRPGLRTIAYMIKSELRVPYRCVVPVWRVTARPSGGSLGVPPYVCRTQRPAPAVPAPVRRVHVPSDDWRAPGEPSRRDRDDRNGA